jgi:ATP-dependent DNA ligase
VQPPLEPMLGRLARELPADGFMYEPKWDGFRCLAFCSGDEIDLRSRNNRPLARYFPELVEGFRSLSVERLVLDGEIVVAGADGFDFEALLARLHPAASRVERLRQETPAYFVAFDLLVLGDEDMRQRPFAERRSLLCDVLESAKGALIVTPLTEQREVATRWLDRFRGHGLDGVIAKHRELRYLEGERAMLKIKQERTADCVVAGFRWFTDRPLLSSLLLGLYDEHNLLQHVGVVTAFSEKRRREVLDEIAALVRPLSGHPWEQGFLVGGSPVGRLKGAAGRWTPDMGLDWVPLAPERVCEVAYDHVDRHRFRHPARFRRWRLDREPLSCRFDQLAEAPIRLEEVVAGR